MNLHSTKPNGKEVESVSNRVKNTKKEIEQLKSQLEELINLGTAQPTYLFTQRKSPEINRSPSPKIHETNTSAAKTKKIVPEVPKKAEPAKISPSKKTRSYNVEQAREYIKKQKEKRAEQLKAQIHTTENRLDLKKERLRELHRKTRELVAKNVQQKRERSKSREPPVRLDKSQTRQKENVTNVRQNLSSRSQERQKKSVLKPRAASHGREKVEQIRKETRRSKSQERTKFQDVEHKDRISRTRTRNKPESATKDFPLKKQEVDPNFLYPPDAKIGTSKLKTIESEKTIYQPRKKPEATVTKFVESQKTDSNFLCPTNIKLNKPGPIDLEKTIYPINDKIDSNFGQSANLQKTSKQESNFPKRDDLEKKKNITKHVLEHSIMTDACLKDSKETQTNRENSFDGIAWMKPPPALPYPYNFINTVKKKLQYAINSPRSYVDVGVQNSDDNFKTPEEGKSKSKEEIKAMLIKSTQSELRSFASHKCQNLDLKVVENLELVPNSQSRAKSKNEAVSKNLFTNYDSESDTSKNIPDISSESLSSIHSRPQLSLEKLKDLKLQKSASHSNIKTDLNGFGQGDQGSYSSDFQKETLKTKSSSKSSSTIKTIATEKPIVPSDSLNLDNNTQNNYSSSFKTKETTSKRSDVQSFSNFSERDKKKETGDSSHLSLKSSIPETQIPKAASEFSYKPIPEPLALKEPSVSLSTRKDKNSNVSRNLMNTVTIRSGLGSLQKSYLSGDDSQGTFKSLLTEDQISKSSSESIQESLSQRSNSKSVSIEKTNSLNLKEPSVSLVVGKQQKLDEVVKSQMKNITIRSSPSANNNANEIHLKFEAEVRLLNDFNESFKQFMSVQKAFENIKNKNETNLAMWKIFQNVDTQTSVVAKSSTNLSTPRDTRNSINYSRGSETIEEFNDSPMNNSQITSKSLQDSSLDWNLSNFNESSITNMTIGDEGKSRFSIESIENQNVDNCASILSLNIFDQLIKDEDVRIKQLKAIIKIREQALLDRTKGELVWLEIQRKQLIETGKIEEASLLKKKQRGIILKHEQERNEIKKLKQMQQEASQQRKNTLKQQRNLIKTQLSTDKMLSKITVKKSKERRRSMGPLRVVQSCSESIHSEASFSLKSSGIEDVLSITSKSVRVSGESEVELKGAKEEEVQVSIARRTLLMREAALQKRRKAAEELLRWHRKLLDEERKIGELEAAATSVVRQTPETQKDKYKFTGSQLNRLWRAMTGSDEKKFVEDKHYVMSLERLCKSARQYSNRNKKTSTKNIQQTNESGDAEKFAKKTSADDVNYSSGFEPESVQEMINSQEEKTKISSISELIDNFSKIEDEISTLSRNSESIVNLKEDSDRSSQALQNRFEEIQSEIEESKAVTNESEVSSSKDIEDEELSVVEIIEEPKEETADSSIKLSPKEETEGSSIKLSLKEETGGSSIKLSPKEETEDSSIKLSLKEGTEDSSVKLSPEEEAEDSSIKLSPKDISAPEEYTEQTEKTVEDETTKSTQEIPTQTTAEESEQQKSQEILTTPEDQDILKSIQEIPTIQDQISTESVEDLEQKSKEVSTVLEDEDKTKSALVSTTLEDEDKTKSVIQDQVVTTEAVEASEQRESQEVSTFVEDEKTSTLDEDLEEVSSQKDILVESKSSIPFEEENSSQKSPQVSFKTQELAKEDTSLQSEEPEPESEEKSSVESKYDELSKSIEASENTTNKKSSKKSQIEQETDTQKTSTTITTQEKIEDIQESTTESLSKDVGKDLEEALESASKIEESLSKLNEKLSNEKTVSKDKSEEVSTDKNEEISTEKEAESIGEMQSSSKEESSNSVNTETDEKTPQKKINQIDVKKRVSEILADASPSRGDKSPRLQDLYITAYDVGAANSPEHNESNEDGRQLPTDIFGSEAEELWRKQLAIEQEIKQIELQQKEQLPYVFMREIPNKPPPPYTPPSSLLSLPQSILPTDVKEINEIASYSSKVLFKAYQNNNLDKVKFSENGFKLFSKIDVSKICAEYVFNICRDIATDYYRQFEVVEGPSWLVVIKKPQLAKIKLPDATGLERILSQKLKELFGFKKAQVAESAIIKWGRKKRDHVDEVLVIESQEEESQWTNFDKDELIVKNQVTDEIMKMLLEETANVFEKILSKKKSAAG